MMGIDNSLALNSLQKSAQNSSNLGKLSGDDAKLKEKTDEFEAVMIRTILDTSLKLDNSLFPKEAGDDIYQFMYKDSLSKSLSGGFGYSQLLFDFLKEQQKGNIK